MPREKNTRKLNFKPIINSYVPEDNNSTGITTLLHEEIEAIYLMDVLSLYQEDAAKSMEVSRPTFTRILKSARKKLALGIVSGHNIKFEDSSTTTYIAICCNEENHFKNTLPDAKFISIYKKENSDLILYKTIKNPIFQSKEKPAIILPNLLQKNKVNYFISTHIGAGLQNSLLMKGIKPIEKKITSTEGLNSFS